MIEIIKKEIKSKWKTKDDQSFKQATERFDFFLSRNLFYDSFLH